MNQSNKHHEEQIQDQVRAKYNPRWREAHQRHLAWLRTATSRKVKKALKGG